MKFIYFVVLYICILTSTQAQYKSATVGIDGLTCSMCSNSVDRLIRQLDFVAEVKMDLNSTTAYVTFHPGKKVNIYEIAKKVQDSGFSVRSIQAVFNFNNVNAKDGVSFVYDGDEYIFVKTSDQLLNGEKQIIFLGKDYISKKEFAHWKNVLSKYKGTAKEKTGVYHITL